MNKKFLVSTLIVFVVWMGGSFLVHGAWLSSTYATMADIMRPMEDANAMMHFMLIAHLMMAGAFVWIYQRGNEDKPWLQQGIRFGVAVAIMAPIPTFMIYYVVQQTPAMLAVKQSIGDGAVVVLVGVVTAFLNRKSA